MRNIKGFTLIELVVVITIIAILAALALPRFESLQSQARIAKAQAILGGVRAAAAIAKSACLADMATSQIPTCTATSGVILMEGVPVSMLNQYPAPTANLGAPWGVLAAAQLTVANDDIAPKLQGTTLTIDINGGSIPNCRVVYASPSSPGGGPTFGLSTSGC